MPNRSLAIHQHRLESVFQLEVPTDVQYRYIRGYFQRYNFSVRSNNSYIMHEWTFYDFYWDLCHSLVWICSHHFSICPYFQPMQPVGRKSRLADLQPLIADRILSKSYSIIVVSNNLSLDVKDVPSLTRFWVSLSWILRDFECDRGNRENFCNLSIG
jgi:hypothetical protein